MHCPPSGHPARSWHCLRDSSYSNLPLFKQSRRAWRGRTPHATVLWFQVSTALCRQGSSEEQPFAQVPLTHVSPLRQACPHAPQPALSFCRSIQLRPHRLRDGKQPKASHSEQVAHAIWHSPDTHFSHRVQRETSSPVVRSH